MNIKKQAVRISDLVDKVEKGFLFLAVVSLFVMMVLITTNTVLRYLFNDPITGMFEVVELYLMMAVFYFAIAHVEHEGGNVQVDLLSRKFPSRIRRRVEVAYLLSTFVVVLWIMMLVFRRTRSFWEQGSTTSGVIQFPIYLSWAIVVIGLVLLLLRLLMKSVRNLHAGAVLLICESVDGGNDG